MEAHEFLLKHSQRWSLKYPGKHIAMVNNEIVAIGDSELKVFKKAKEKYPKKEVSIAYIPTDEEMVTLLILTRLEYALTSMKKSSSFTPKVNYQKAVSIENFVMGIFETVLESIISKFTHIWIIY